MITDRPPQLAVLPRSYGRQFARVGIGFVVFLSVLWILVTGLLWANESRLVFRADWTHRFLQPGAFRTRSFAAADGQRLEGVVFSAPANDARYWILFCPPSGASIHALRVHQQLETLRSFGYHVFAFDYRGFGRTDGTPDEDGVYADALGAYRYLTGTIGVPASRVILAGRSLGSAVAVETALRVQAAGLMLFSPIDSVPLTAARLYPWAPVTWLATNQFDNGAKVARLHTPVLIVHAINDRLIPLSAARALFQQIVAPKAMLETSGGHNRAGFASPTELEEAMRRFWPPLGSRVAE